MTGYGLTGPRIESRLGLDFPTRPDRRWGPPSLLYNCTVSCEWYTDVNDISVNCNWVATRWQQYSTHLHTHTHTQYTERHKTKYL